MKPGAASAVMPANAPCGRPSRHGKAAAMGSTGFAGAADDGAADDDAVQPSRGGQRGADIVAVGKVAADTAGQGRVIGDGAALLRHHEQALREWALEIAMQAQPGLQLGRSLQQRGGQRARQARSAPGAVLS